MPSGQEAFIKCRALPAKCLHRAFTSFFPFRFKTLKWSLTRWRGQISWYVFTALGRSGIAGTPLGLAPGWSELGSSCWDQERKGWGKFEQLKYWRKTGWIANSPCTHSWRNTVLTSQIPHCVKSAASKHTSRKLSMYSIPLVLISVFYT